MVKRTLALNAHVSTEPATAPPKQQQNHIPNAQAQEKTA